VTGQRCADAILMVVFALETTRRPAPRSDPQARTRQPTVTEQLLQVGVRLLRVRRGASTGQQTHGSTLTALFAAPTHCSLPALYSRATRKLQCAPQRGAFALSMAGSLNIVLRPVLVGDGRGPPPPNARQRPAMLWFERGETDQPASLGDRPRNERALLWRVPRA
jgi:hypothetical protein